MPSLRSSARLLGKFAYPRRTTCSKTLRSAPWTYWNNVSQSAFGELTYKLGGDWALRGVFTYKDVKSDAKLLYAFGAPDPVTGRGVVGMTGIYPSRYRQYLVDGYAGWRAAQMPVQQITTESSHEVDHT